ncbi:hypothetical protein [Kutzneria sp. CA-103260]|uniref:hypothetical protein n=1 Tax=Kutzneria sp. CA-103260 TaxID=2802641 RepID=UPI001BEE97EC|nr:hypothetical protein [Kutzneria sp. CA-103260]QUQ67561.1 hypothetical protein JJ691_52960 [Kutzneria sp. CA-103260]
MFVRALAAVAAVGLLAAACGSAPASMPMSPTTSPSSMSMPGMAMGDGLAAESGGYTFSPASTTVSGPFTFRILGPDGKAVTEFEPEQTKLMHFYLVRSDLTGFQHVHPTMAADGTWTAPLTAAQPGDYRVYAQFVVKGTDEVLSQAVTVPGAATTSALAAPSATTEVDGYTLTLSGEKPMAGMSHQLTVSVARDGLPVSDLQPYLDTYAHVSAFHAGDLAFAHLHPQGEVSGDHGGPQLTFEAMLPKPGNWRLYIQFQTAGVLHTAAMTVAVS